MCTKFICFDCRGKYGAWTVTDMEDAMDCLKNGDAGLKEVARLYNVPKATPKRHVDNQNKYYANGNKKYSGRQHPYRLNWKVYWSSTAWNLNL